MLGKIYLHNQHGCLYLLKIISYLADLGASLVVQTVKNLPAVQQTQVRFLGQEDPLEKEMVICCSILAWRSSWTEGPDGPQLMGCKESDTTE